MIIVWSFKAFARPKRFAYFLIFPLKRFAYFLIFSLKRFAYFLRFLYFCTAKRHKTKKLKLS